MSENKDLTYNSTPGFWELLAVKTFDNFFSIDSKTAKNEIEVSKSRPRNHGRSVRRSDKHVHLHNTTNNYYVNKGDVYVDSDFDSKKRKRNR